MTSTRLTQIDLIKTLAIVLVVSYHCTPASMFPVGEAPQIVPYFVKCLHAICVPLFFMASGYLMLPRPLDSTRHFVKTARMTIVTVIWSTLTIVTAYAIFGDQFSISSMVKDIFTLRIGYNNHFWYMQSMIAIMLAYPIFKACFSDPSKIALYCLLGLLTAFTFVDQGLNILANVASDIIKGTMPVSGNLPWKRDLLNSTKISIFNTLAWPVVYFLVGGILADAKIEIRSKMTLAIAVSGFFSAAAALTAYGLMASKHTPTMFDSVFHGYNTPFGLIMTVSAFLILMKMPAPNTFFTKVTSTIALSTFGIYMIHLPVKWVMIKLIPFDTLNQYGQWALLTTTCSTIAFLITTLFLRVRPVSSLLKL